MTCYCSSVAKLKICFILCLYSAELTGQGLSAKGFISSSDIEKYPSSDFLVSNQFFSPNILEGGKKLFRESSKPSAQTLFFNYTIPVVVHIISQNPYAITDQQIIDSINDLNDAFAHAGRYAGGTGANTGINFCLAKIDPDGGITNGITRTESVLSDFDQDIENDALKNLVSWDTKQYCNIWYVQGIKSEILTSFSCGVWTRLHEGGYAGLSSGGDYRDGIVTTEFGYLLAHEMGHYLGLLHTFVIGSCTNTDCSVDGDGICDTPPQSVPGGSCTNPQNSCSTDTVSGFSMDVPDLNSNFMSYSGSCTNEFTEGQAGKMRNNLTTVRSSLLAQSKCDPPCGENILASFTRSNWSPAIGDNIIFNSTSTGGTNYQWSVDGVVVGTNSPGYNQTFTQTGKFKVTLKVFNTNPDCYAAYSDDIIVNCGVMARFYPDKREIASRAPFYVDSILFTNRSVNATAYQWLMSKDTGMNEQVVSTAFNLNYIFLTPGNYSVRLIAFNGSCSDTTEKFMFTVHDATPDGYLNLADVECFDQTKIKVTFDVSNLGYGPIPPNIPITFYDADPRSGNANKLDTTFFTRDTVQGKCYGRAYVYTLDIRKTGLNQLYAVFNDSGTTNPLVLPNTKFVESNYLNNVAVANNFQFKVTAAPPTATLEPGDTLQLSVTAEHGIIASILWSTSEDLSCTDCANPILIANKDITKKVMATSQLGCIDSSSVLIKVPPADDYVIMIDSMQCANNDSLHANFTICNNFKRGKIPTGLEVSFFDADPLSSGAHLLNPVFVTNNTDTGKCISFAHIFKGITAGKIFAAVNNDGSQIPILFPEDSLFLEKEYSNNISSFFYQQDTVSLQPGDTSVIKDASFPIHINTNLSNPGSINWLPGDGYSLSCTNCLSPVITVSAFSLVQMQMENQFGCVLSGETKIKIVSGGKVSIPNAFTPNHDGHNDIFYILGSREISVIKDFSIFNRWGQKIFQVLNAAPNDPSFGWDGSFNGQEAEPGTYVYFATIIFTNGSEQVYKGTVTLIR